MQAGAAWPRLKPFVLELLVSLIGKQVPLRIDAFDGVCRWPHDVLHCVTSALFWGPALWRLHMLCSLVPVRSLALHYSLQVGSLTNPWHCSLSAGTQTCI